MNERQQTSTPEEKNNAETLRRVPTFLPTPREGGNEEVLRLMRAL